MWVGWLCALWPFRMFWNFIFLVGRPTESGGHKIGAPRTLSSVRSCRHAAAVFPQVHGHGERSLPPCVAPRPCQWGVFGVGSRSIWPLYRLFRAFGSHCRPLRSLRGGASFPPSPRALWGVLYMPTSRFQHHKAASRPPLRTPTTTLISLTAGFWVRSKRS